jgi:hypothetical protein
MGGVCVRAEMTNNRIVVAAAILGVCLLLGGLLAGGIYTTVTVVPRMGSWVVTNRFTGSSWVCAVLWDDCRPATHWKDAEPSPSPSPDWDKYWQEQVDKFERKQKQAP